MTAGVATTVVSAAAIESVLRLLAVTSDDGVTIGNVRLAPIWPEVVARNRSLLDEWAPGGVWKESYLVFDPELGWVVGRDRATADGLYISSAEGIRSGERGIAFAESRPAYRIAIVGDSNAFSLEVPFDESWAHRLEALLGSDVQVLNFGVNGYGIDQAVLRYERDVRPFLPDLVIFAFIQHDLDRSMTVYPFISFPSWEMPFAKPRFLADDAQTLPVNTPLPEPQWLFNRRRLQDLPHIDLDLGYRYWQEGRTNAFMLGRFFTTVVPRYPSLQELRAIQEHLNAIESEQHSP